jgi:hypothetical protein
MSNEPKQRFKQYVGQESGGSRPTGKGFITERQRLNLQPAYLDYLVQKNKKKNHFPKRVSDDKWAEVKQELKARQRPPQVAGNNKKGKAQEPKKAKNQKNQQNQQNQKNPKNPKTKKPKTKNAAAPSAAPPSSPRRSGRIKEKKKK